MSASVASERPHRTVFNGRGHVLWALVIAAPIVALVAPRFGRDPGAISSPLLNHRAPSFTLRTLDYKPFSLASLRGRPVVLNFWASWCLACKVEQPYLIQSLLRKK